MLLEVTLASLSDIITNIGVAGTWIWTHFSSYLETIMTNSLLLYPIAISLGASVLFVVVKIAKKFGIRSRRFR